VENDLDEIFAWGNVVQVSDRIAIRSVIDNDGLPGLQAIHVETENHLRPG
jgi:hypothetical protein